ncbi:TPA: DNA methyltransferase [Clostridium perfringens]|uniref:Eco57I restriction-modification methylase domain-containing protein n=1 Tax=Clostridium perfringens TaxID=1502 RepID=UPI0024BC7453|nr:DNA methyltransferase [Clostridium perfringens]
MKEITTRNILKNWSKEIMIKMNSMNENMYFEHKNFVIRVFAVISIYRAKNKSLGSLSKKYLNEDIIWKKVQKLYEGNRSIHVSLNDIDDLFFEEVIRFLDDFCKKNYEHLDNLLAWFYQYLNINRRDNDYKDTQFFTDQYMVEYLVKIGLDNLKEKKLENIYSIDPACGGGNFLVALIEKLYFRLNMKKEEFLKYIEVHISGYEIDKNLAIICIINIYIKLLELEIVELEEIFQFNLNVFYDIDNKMGALLKEEISNLIRVTDYTEYNYYEVFTGKYDLILMNPPFKGRREQEKLIRDYITKNYKVAKGDICCAFMVRALDLLQNDGVASVVVQNGWMYLESYKELRKQILEVGDIIQIVDLGSNSFSDLSGEKTNVSLLIYGRKKIKSKFEVFGLKQYSYNIKSKMLKDLNIDKKDIYEVDTKKVLDDKELRIEYLSSGNVKRAFNDLEAYSEYGKAMQGTSTGDSKKFVKYHWEVVGLDEWKFVSKGGGYCKWSGLNIFKVNWGKNGEIISKHPKSVLRNVQYFDSTELVYSDTGTSGLSVRLLQENQIFIASGPGIRVIKGDKYCHLAFLNSRLASYYIKILTPKLTISATYIGKIPVKGEILFDEKIKNASKRIVELKEIYNQKRPINREYKMDNFLKYNSIYEYVKEIFKEDLEIEKERLKLESYVNNKIINYYDFTDEEINDIYLKVGKNPYEINTANDIKNLEWLDQVIVKSLDNNCYIKKSARCSKETLGVEGILEFLAVKYGLNVERTYEVIVSNIESLPKILNHYYKHILHCVKLGEINYLNQHNKDFEELKIKEKVLEDKEKFKICIDINKWFTTELYKWHSDAFFKKPLIENRGKSNE